MKRILFTSVFLTGLLFGGTYTTTEAANHMGENATICGIVSGGYYGKSLKGKPTFINLDGAYPNHVFTIVIWGSDRHKFSSPEERYNNKNLCATGIIDSYKGRPQIVVSEKSQLGNR